MAKVLITETVHPSGPELLAAAGHQIVYANRDMDVVRREIVDAEAVFTRILDLPVSLLETAKDLKIISKHGVGLDNIPVDYCKAHGIAVTTAPGANSQSVAEHALALMMALCKNLKKVSTAYRNVGFAAKDSAPGMEVEGKTVGVIGFGRIGSRMARMCVGLGMQVQVYDPYVTEVPEGMTQVNSLDELLSNADVVTLHCALTDETRGMLGKEQLALMKPTAILVNCARGPVMDEEALIEALEQGGIAGAGLDVTAHEPCDPDSPLFKMDNVILTPHYAPTTRESSRKVSEIGCQNIISYLSGEAPVGRIV